MRTSKKIRLYWVDEDGDLCSLCFERKWPNRLVAGYHLVSCGWQYSIHERDIGVDFFVSEEQALLVTAERAEAAALKAEKAATKARNLAGKIKALRDNRGDE